MLLPPSEHSEINVDGIIDNLRRYMLSRFKHANRIKPEFRHLESDLVWHELQAVRQVLSESKPYAEFRFVIADVLISFDKEKKWGVYSPSDQNCIQSEIVTHVEEMSGKEKTDVIAIRDMRGIYKMMDPSLDLLLQLIQIWVWWDLRDASDFFLFDTQMALLRDLPKKECDERMILVYRKEMKLDEKEPSPDLQRIYAFEYDRTKDMVEKMAFRIENAPIYEEIIGYEDGGDPQVDEKILQLAHHLRACDLLNEKKDLDASWLEHYAHVLHCPADQVDKEKAAAYEERYLQRGKSELSDMLRNFEDNCVRYNMKARLLKEVVALFRHVPSNMSATPTEQEEAAV